MLYYDRIGVSEVSEVTHVNKKSASKEHIICYYCFFKIKGLGFKHCL